VPDYEFPLGAPLPSNPVCFLDVMVGGKPIGRIEIEVQADLVPLAAENFVQLCEYAVLRGTTFHRVIPGF